jgi:hypothetical protein
LSCSFVINHFGPASTFLRSQISGQTPFPSLIPDLVRQQSYPKPNPPFSSTTTLCFIYHPSCRPLPAIVLCCIKQTNQKISNATISASDAHQLLIATAASCRAHHSSFGASSESCQTPAMMLRGCSLTMGDHRKPCSL